MKRNIIAIGGGRLRSGPPQTTAIDREIVALSGKAKPRLLFIPTASLDPEDYCQAIERQFGYGSHLLDFRTDFGQCSAKFLLLRENDRDSEYP